MSNDEKEQGNTDHSTIQPARLNLTQTGAGAGSEKPAPAQGNKNRWFWPTLSILLLIAAGVVFFLPGFIQPPVLNVDTSAPASETNSPTSSRSTAQSQVSASSPWAEAQEARQRQESQELLSELLELQEELEQKNVEVWANDDYDHALQLAADGDRAYRERDFRLSSTLYGDALSRMKSLLADLEPLFEATLAEGNESIRNADSEKAQEIFQHALLMKPDEERALTGLQRSKTLDQVLQLITDGDDLQQNGDFESARKKYEQALALDQYAERAAAQIQNVNKKILDRNFRQLMSDGYAHLESDELNQAKTAFQRAEKLKPGSKEAASALSQTQTRIINKQITMFLDNAVALEQKEEWNAALEAYNKALALDPNLAQAQEGKLYTANRADLDSRLEQIIAEPQRLTNKSVQEETRQVYQQLSALSAPGARLTRQLQKIGELLDLVSTPVQVTFRSDNETEVVIYRVGTLGKFQEKNLTLLPGEYVAHGTREGYRDVRVEFTVEADTPVQPVSISAEEKIAAR